MWPVDHLQARNHVKKSAAVKSALEQGSEGAVTPRVNVRRPRRRRRRRRRRRWRGNLSTVASSNKLFCYEEIIMYELVGLEKERK